MEAHPGAMEAHPGAMEACPGAMEAHPGAMVNIFVMCKKNQVEIHKNKKLVICSSVTAKPLSNWNFDLIFSMKHFWDIQLQWSVTHWWNPQWGLGSNSIVVFFIGERECTFLAQPTQPMYICRCGVNSCLYCQADPLRYGVEG